MATEFMAKVFSSKQLIDRLKRAARTFMLSALVSLGFMSGAAAHPHAWIDLRSTVIMDDTGKVTGIAQEWLFDPLYTLFITHGVDPDPVKQEKYFMDLARTNLQNLREFNYFTEVRVEGNHALFAPATDYESELREKRLWMKFTITLQTPVDPSLSKFDFAIYDPTYYIEMLHLKDETVSFGGVGAEQTDCEALITKPTPSVEMMIMAQALPPGASSDDLVEEGSLGELFAERVDVSCQ